MWLNLYPVHVLEKETVYMKKNGILVQLRTGLKLKNSNVIIMGITRAINRNRMIKKRNEKNFIFIMS